MTSEVPVRRFEAPVPLSADPAVKVYSGIICMSCQHKIAENQRLTIEDIRALPDGPCPNCGSIGALLPPSDPDPETICPDVELPSSWR